MDVSANALRKETLSVLTVVTERIKAVEQEASIMGVSPAEVRDTNGNFIYTPELMLAKAVSLNTLALLREPPILPRGRAAR